VRLLTAKWEREKRKQLMEKTKETIGKKVKGGIRKPSNEMPSSAAV
jgi:hypothetical protein